MVILEQNIPANSDHPEQPDHLVQVDRALQAVFGAFMDRTTGQIFNRIRSALEGFSVPNHPSVQHLSDVTETFVAELERSLRKTDLAEAITDLIHDLNNELDVSESVSITVPVAGEDGGPGHMTELQIPLRALILRLIDQEFLENLADRLDEALLPSVRVLIGLRGFVCEVIRTDAAPETEEDFLGPKELKDNILQDLAAQEDLVRHRLQVWISGICSEAQAWVLRWHDDPTLPAGTKSKVRARQIQQAESRAHQYERTLQGMLGTLEADLELQRTDSRLWDIIDAQVRKPASRIGEELADAVDLLTRALTASHKRISHATEREDSTDALIESITTQREQIHHRISEQALAKLDQIRDEIAGAKSVERVRKNLQDLAHDLPERIELLNPEDMTRIQRGELPETAFAAPLRTPAIEALQHKVAWQVAATREALAGLLQRARNELYQTERIVGFNLESAISEIQTAPDQEQIVSTVQEIIVGPLQRAIEHIEPLAEELRAQSRSTVEALDLGLQNTLKDLRNKVLGSSEYVAHDPPASRALLWFWDRLMDSLESVQQIFSFVVKGIGRSIYKGIGWVGGRWERARVQKLPHGVSDPEEIGQAQELSLPHAYRMLFRSKPVTAPEMLVARQEPLGKIATAMRRVQAGLPASIAVIGPPGTGRSSLVEVARSHILDHLNCHLIRLEAGWDEPKLARNLANRLGTRAENLPDLAHHLSTRTEPTAVILDDIDCLFRRSPGGLHALEALRLLVTHTSSSVLWIVTINEALWRFLVRIGRFPHAFTEPVHLDPLPPKAIRELILSRHSLSGYNLRLPTIPWRQRLRSSLSQRGSKELPEERALFETIAEYSHGNPDLAMILWRRSLEPTGQGHMRVNLPERPSFLPIVDEDLDSQATLCTILLQGSIDTETHAQVFGWDNDKSERTLLGLQQRGWIKSVRPSDPHQSWSYRLVRSVRVDLARYLQRRGLLP